MNNNGSKIAVILGVVVILALLLFGVYRVIRPLLFGKPAKPLNPQVNLLDYVDRDTQVRFSIEGPVTANEIHNTIRIAVTKDNRILEGLNTYDATSTLSQTFPNNAGAFEDFIYALNNAGFIKRDPKATTADERGICPSGQRYIYELIEGGQTVTRLWSSTCGGGNFAGQSDTIRTLFQNQIPQYNKLTANIKMTTQ
jgi:hypothetical protein